MHVAVLSDIHGNLPALIAVLDDLDGRGQQVDELWCLGDVVGYGAEPDGCAALTADRADTCLAGNHDLVVRGDLDVGTFTRSAAAAARWTKRNINEQTRSFLAPLTATGRADGVGLYHGSPRDPVWEYVLSLDQARRSLDAQEERVCLIGHSHVACFFHRRDIVVDGDLARAGAELDLADGEWLVNPGSVGQPRDGDPRAAYLMLDTEGWTASFRRVEYPIQEAADAILAAGLPADLAQRLYVGQ
jgi:predicted phosphodiesterase